MYKYIKTTDNVPLLLDIEVTVSNPLFYSDFDEISAAFDSNNLNNPKGPVISKDRNRITQQMISDYESFIDDIEYICECKYGLILVYDNTSNDHSHYYSYLAKDDEGNILGRLRFRLRISNHPAKRTKKQSQNKKEELDSPVLHQYLSDEQIKKMNVYSKEVIVNDQLFDSYEEAYDPVEDIIERALELMKRRGQR